MEKTRRLVLILEGLALVVATVLILVDYKLKNDLVELYRKMEGTLARGKEFMGESSIPADHPSGLRDSYLVDHVSTVETPTAEHSGNGNGNASTASKRATAKRSGGTRDSAVPQPDKRVGP
jgi:hypothetical protein